MKKNMNPMMTSEVSLFQCGDKAALVHFITLVAQVFYIKNIDHVNDTNTCNYIKSILIS